MPTADRYSRLVLWLKVTLPLLALAILSTLFFVAETLDPEAAIPYAEVDVARILREQGVTRPTYGGVFDSGVSLNLSAEAVRPGGDGQNVLDGSQLSARFSFPSGADLQIESPVGIVDPGANAVTLRGGAVLKSSTGYAVVTEEIVASLSEASILAKEEILAEGPPGRITAGRMELMRSSGADPTYLLVFKDGVRLVYTPKETSEP
ncbi:MAG: hypothetical protein AAF636_28485 [Pseudomonadota bacterium]